MEELYIGIDGGGTRSTILAADAQGNILRESAGPGLNYLNDGLETCVCRFEEMISRVMPAGFSGSGTVCAGLSALDGPAPEDVSGAFRSVLPPSFHLKLCSDLSTALAGHTLGGPGLMAVCGTGSMLLVRNSAGEERAAGGWGWKIGDPGSGYALAQAGLYRALHRFEAEKRETPLLRAALSFFGCGKPRDILLPVYAPGFGVDALAAFGKQVVHLAEQGDPDAGEILRGQLAEFASLAASLLRDVPEAASAAGLYGALFQHSRAARNIFSEELRKRVPGCAVAMAARSPAQGAVYLAMAEARERKRKK